MNRYYQERGSIKLEFYFEPFNKKKMVLSINSQKWQIKLGGVGAYWGQRESPQEEDIV